MPIVLLQAVLCSPLPAALEIHAFPGEVRTVYGVPKPEKLEGYLHLDWFDQGRRFRTKLRALLAALEIKVPRGTRMVINVKADSHPKLGPCIKLWWEENCFVPIEEKEEES